MKIKTTMRYHFILVRMVTVKKKAEDSKYRCEEIGTLVY